jgi:hypothetical protein
MYGCETLSVTLREEGRLKVFENRELRGIFGYVAQEVWVISAGSEFARPPYWYY